MLLLISYTPVFRNKDKTFIAPNLYISTDILSSPAKLALTANNVVIIWYQDGVVGIAISLN